MRRRFIQNKKESLWTPFYIEALEDGVSFSIGDEMEYKIDDGDWISLGKNVNSESINKGSRLYIKGQIVNTLYRNTFSIQGLCKIGGDIKSLSFREQAKKINFINYGQFQFLFENCTTIKEVLIDFHLITTLGQLCFHRMFSGCTSLVKVHNLPAVTLKEACYLSMFVGCTNLNHIRMLATDISAMDCLTNWVNGVSPTGTFVVSKDATWDTTPGALGDSGVPAGWTVVNDGEESGGNSLFPATIIYSYNNENIPNYTIAKYFIDTYPDMVVGNSGEYTPITEDVTIQGSNYCDGKVVGVEKWVNGESLLFYTENSISKWYALRVFVDYGATPNGSTNEFLTD